MKKIIIIIKEIISFAIIIMTALFYLLCALVYIQSILFYQFNLSIFNQINTTHKHQFLADDHFLAQRLNGHFLYCCWDAIISFPFVKDGKVYPMLKEIKKEALISLAFRKFDQLLSWLSFRYFRVIHSVRNLPKAKKTIWLQPR